MNASVDASTMRRMNRSMVLRLIRDLRTTSRIDISQMTGLNKATVSHIVDELIEEQFVLEIGYGSSSGGRKPMLIRFNSNAAYAVGVDVQPSKITTVVCNIRGESTYKEVVPVSLHSDQQDRRQELLDIVVQQISRAAEVVPKSAYGLVGAGVSVPGMVDFNQGVVHYMPGVYRGEWHIREELAHRFPFPVFCDNDANCGAWNEFKVQRIQAKNLVYISAGIGIGAGIIIDGRLYRGHNGMAGEFGHMTINPMGAICECGNFGCWELYASDRGLALHLREAGDDFTAYNLDKPLVEQALARAEEDNLSAIRAFHTLGQYLGVGIANILNALNPEVIVLGGSMVSAATFVLPEIERVVHHRAVFNNKNVSLHTANINAAAIGASSLAIDEILFSSPEVADAPNA